VQNNNVNRDEQQCRRQLRHFIESNMTVFDDDAVLTDDTNIFSSGFVNSTFAMRLLTFIEREFAVTVPDDDILLANFSSVDAMWQLTTRLSGSTCDA